MGVSDSDLLNRLREILQNSDLDTATAGSVRRQLEEEFGVDLHDRKAFIREQIDVFLQNPVLESKNDDADQVQREEEDGNNEEIDSKEEEEEQSEESNEGAIKGKRSYKTDSNEKKKGRGFSKPCAISPQLQEIVGVPEMSRTEVVKKIWEYIRKKDLQNPKDKRQIMCDETLRGIFRVNTINMFKMNIVLSKHIWPIEVEDETPIVKSSRKDGKLKRSRQEGVNDETKRKGKQQKGKPSGFLKPIPMSDALVEFFGTGDTELPRSNVVKRMWEYIKENDLQDPTDRRRIICDEKLYKLFNVGSFTGFGMSKLLTPHFVKPDE